VNVRECAIEAFDGRDASALERRIERWILLALPLRPPDDRLVLAESLGEPAWNVVLRQLDGEDVAELVPEHVAPVELPRAGGHRGERLPKADALDADVR